MARIRIAVIVLAATALVVALSPALAAAQDASIGETVERIFEGVPVSDSMSTCFKDERDEVYRCYHLSRYLDLQELRAYEVTFENVAEYGIDPDGLLEAGDQEGAFEILIDKLRIRLGSRYVADVALDGINPDPVSIGAGSIRDNFHQSVFGTHDEADRFYRAWLERGVALKEQAGS